MRLGVDKMNHFKKQMMSIIASNEIIEYEMEKYDKNPFRMFELGDRKSYLQKIVDEQRLMLVNKLDGDIFKNLQGIEVAVTNYCGEKKRKYIFHSPIQEEK